MTELMKDLYQHSRTCMKIYDGEKEQKIRYEISRYKEGFTVTANHIAEEPGSRRCIANYNKGVPCQCISTYLQSQCMKKTHEWYPTDSKEFYLVLYKLAEFKNNFRTFSGEELAETAKRFNAIFETKAEVEEDVVCFEQLPDENSHTKVYKNGDKIFKFILL